LRFGTSAGTARGLDEADFAAIGRFISEVLQALAAGDTAASADTQAQVLAGVAELTDAHPIYPVRSVVV